jgi:hypothetical protein
MPASRRRGGQYTSVDNGGADDDRRVCFANDDGVVRQKRSAPSNKYWLHTNPRRRRTFAANVCGSAGVVAARRWRSTGNGK